MSPIAGCADMMTKGTKSEKPKVYIAFSLTEHHPAMLADDPAAPVTNRPDRGRNGGKS